jgi:hypothetical protein
MYESVYVCPYIHMYKTIHVYVCVCIHVHVCMSRQYMHVCVCVCTYIHVYMQAHTHVVISTHTYIHTCSAFTIMAWSADIWVVKEEGLTCSVVEEDRQTSCKKDQGEVCVICGR